MRNNIWYSRSKCKCGERERTTVALQMLMPLRDIHPPESSLARSRRYNQTINYILSRRFRSTHTHTHTYTLSPPSTPARCSCTRSSSTINVLPHLSRGVFPRRRAFYLYLPSDDVSTASLKSSAPRACLISPERAMRNEVLGTFSTGKRESPRVCTCTAEEEG